MNVSKLFMIFVYMLTHISDICEGVAILSGSSINDVISKKYFDELAIQINYLKQDVRRAHLQRNHEVSDLHKKLDNLEEKLLHEKDKNDILNQHLNEEKQELHNVKQNCVDVKQELVTIKKNMRGVNIELGVAKKELDILKQNLGMQHNGLKQKLGDVNQELVDVNHGMVDVNHGMVDEKEELNVVKQELSQVKQELAHLKQDLGGMKQELTTCKVQLKETLIKIKHNNIHAVKDKMNIQSDTIDNVKTQEALNQNIVSASKKENMNMPTKSVPYETKFRHIFQQETPIAFAVRTPQSSAGDPGFEGTLVFQDIVSNMGSYYNSTSGQFFCPVYGLYLFSYNILTDRLKGGQDYVYAQFLMDGQGKWNSYTLHQGDDSASTNCGVTVIFQCPQGTYVEVHKYGPGKVNINSGGFSWFSGFLIQPLS